MVLVPLAFLAGLLRIAYVRAGRLDDVDTDEQQAPDADES